MALPRTTPIVDASTGLVNIHWQRVFEAFEQSASLMRGIEVIVAAEVGMATSAQRVVEPLQLPDVGTILYTVPDKTRIQITQATAVNPTGADRTISVYLVEPGDAPNDSNVIVSNRTIAAGATVEFPEMRHALGVGCTIQALCDAASAVSFSVSAAVMF